MGTALSIIAWCQRHCPDFNGQTFSGVFEQFSFTSKFLSLKMQKSTIFLLDTGQLIKFVKKTFFYAGYQRRLTTF